MKFYEFGEISLPHIMLIHGAGWSYWLYLREAELLKQQYHVILPVLDGHGEEGDAPYESTEEEAPEIIDYIDRHSAGQLFALSGVSLGGQIVIEMLTQRENIAKKVMIESALCIPQPALLTYSIFVYRLCSKWLFSKSFNRFGLKLLPKDIKLPETIEQLYLRDIVSIQKKTLEQVFNTYYRYELKEELKNCHAKIQYWYGGKEMRCIKNSAQKFKEWLPACQVIELKGYVHSEISAYRPLVWMEYATAFLEE